jgi:GrpB-like predicted nucleotidyltransferase (UPF0157 family)
MPMGERCILVVPYDPEWARGFEAVRDFLAPAFLGIPYGIEHVGSTSVPGLWAKPILDIDIAIPSYDLFPEAVRRLGDIGYRHRGDLGICGREAFSYEGGRAFPAHHLYVCPGDSSEMRRHLALRDFLRAHPEAVEEYGRVKREGARLYPEDIDAYIAHKGPFIREVYRRCGLE